MQGNTVVPLLTGFEFFDGWPVLGGNLEFGVVDNIEFGVF